MPRHNSYMRDGSENKTVHEIHTPTNTYKKKKKKKKEQKKKTLAVFHYENISFHKSNNHILQKLVARKFFKGSCIHQHPLHNAFLKYGLITSY